ncbi:MAG TPA: CocE/NonD family hydrolase [Rhizomicrobium sp.]
MKSRFAIIVLLAALSGSVHAQSTAFAPDPSIRVDHNVMVPMRDGVTLGTDVYYPVGKGPWPVLLSRTSYDKNRMAREAEMYAQHGYAVVTQDSRGLSASNGDWHPYTDEGRDGYDTQQWIGHQKWSNGKIGMFGTSYPAYTQVAPARYQSKYVKALIPVSAQSSNYGSVWGTDGILALALTMSWAPGQQAIHEKKKLNPVNWMEVMSHLPLKTSQAMTGVVSPFAQDAISHESYDDFWKAMSLREHYADFNVPALHVTGWYDLLLHETIINYLGTSKESKTEYARKNQHLLIGPWGHGVRPVRPYGDADLGALNLDWQATELRWYDHYLKGDDNGVEKDAPIRIFVMGDNVWRDEYEWPLARTKPTRYYLHSQGFANTRAGNGTLTLDAASGDEPADHYRYDPMNPVPTYGGHANGGGPREVMSEGPLDQRVNEMRLDVLNYTGPKLAADTEVTGAPEVELSFSTDVPDTDFYATLSDVYPDGKAIIITEGSLRAKFRDSVEKPSLLEKGKIYTVKIPLWETSNVFKRGHQIRLHITSSNFPRFARNLNSGKNRADETEADARIANQVVYHSKVHDSSLLLPIIPR